MTLYLLLNSRAEDIFAPGVGHGRKVFAVKFHPFNDNVFLTGGWDRCLKVSHELNPSSFHERPMSLSFLKVTTKSGQNKGNLFFVFL